MDIQNKRNEDAEFDRVVELLTPRYQRKNEFIFKSPRRPIGKRLWTMAGVAAVLAVVLMVAFRPMGYVSAREAVNTALARVSDAESVKVEFVLRSVRTDNDEVYSPDMSGSMMGGTLYILRKDGSICNRVDWNDDERHSIIYNGKEYVCLRNGVKVKGHPSGFYDELMNIVNLSFLPDDILKESEITTKGDSIILKHRKDILTFCGEFNRNDKRLVKAYVTASIPDGTDIPILETKSINIDIPLSESLFCK